MYMLVYLSFLIVYVSSIEANRFRCDYTYFKEAGGYLKYQEIPATWHDARLRCVLEGTVLASPLNPALRAAISKSINASYTSIWSGIHATFSKGDYSSIEGVPLRNIEHEWMKYEPDNEQNKEDCIAMDKDGAFADANCNETLPYVCFKKVSPGMAMNGCGSPDNEYNLDKRTNKCYKLHRNPRIWSRAYMACIAEGGYLAIINSDIERQVLQEVFSKGGPLNAPDALIGVGFIGMADFNETGDWRTIHGETLQEAGFDKWAPGEPNNYNKEFCGSMLSNGLLNDSTCNKRATFICEKDPDNLTCDDEGK